MKNKSLFSGLIFFILMAIGLAWAGSVYSLTNITEAALIAGFTFIIALVISSAVKIADPWDKAFVMRFGKFKSLKGPGLFFIVPIIDNITYWMDTRVIITSFKAEKTLTKDTLPVDLDTVLFWKVLDPQKDALEIADYLSAISWASQTALRDVIGKTMLSEITIFTKSFYRNSK